MSVSPRAQMIADLHCHYPMHVMMDRPHGTLEHMLRVRGRPHGDKARAIVLRVASALLNDRRAWSRHRVSLPYLREGNARVVLSVLHSPFNEIDLRHRYGSPPQSHYFEKLLEQIDEVEWDLESWDDSVVTVVRDGDELTRVLDSGAIAMVHCLEGGVDLGPSAEEIEGNVAALKRRGVVYITLAHLFYRQVATNAPAIPFLPDPLYDRVFGQPDGVGLTERGRIAVEAMVRNRILVDLTHMRREAVEQTFAILDRLAPDMPVICSHAGYRFGRQKYMLDAQTVERIAARRGVVGVILAQHQLNDGIRPREKTFEESFAVITQHIDRIHAITGSHEHVAIGSDLDGFIKPTMGGIEHAGRLSRLEAALGRHYGDDAELIASGNVVRLLQDLWRE